MSLSSLLVDDRYIYIYIYIRESAGTDEDDMMICILNERLLFSLAATTVLYRSNEVERLCVGGINLRATTELFGTQQLRESTIVPPTGWIDILCLLLYNI